MESPDCDFEINNPPRELQWRGFGKYEGSFQIWKPGLSEQGVFYSKMSVFKNSLSLPADDTALGENSALTCVYIFS